MNKLEQTPLVRKAVSFVTTPSVDGDADGEAGLFIHICTAHFICDPSTFSAVTVLDLIDLAPRMIVSRSGLHSCCLIWLMPCTCLNLLFPIGTVHLCDDAPGAVVVVGTDRRRRRYGATVAWSLQLQQMLLNVACTVAWSLQLQQMLLNVASSAAPHDRSTVSSRRRR
jgi:hypothetical protein